MKAKKLKKLIQKSLIEVIEKDKYDRLIKEEPNTYQDIMFSDTNQEINKKFRKLFNKILTLRDDLNIHINENRISINSEMSRYTQKLSQDEYLSIEIIKDTGFLFSYGKKRLAFRDKNIYDESLESMKKVFDTLNIDNFQEIYQQVLVDTGLSRQTNLEDLLD